MATEASQTPAAGVPMPSAAAIAEEARRRVAAATHRAAESERRALAAEALLCQPRSLKVQAELTYPLLSASSPFSFQVDRMDIRAKSPKVNFVDLVQRPEILNDTLRRRFVTGRTIGIATKTLAGARELKKSVEFFHLLDSHEYPYSLETLNKAVEGLCRDKLVDEAKHVVFKLKDSIKPDSTTYKHLICGFCDTGDVIEASKLWNLMVDEGFDADMAAVNKMIETFFKKNQFDEALKLFQAMRVDRMDDLGLSTYNLVIDWLCNKGKLSQAHYVFDEMRLRGIQPNDDTLASLLYGLVSKRRVREAYLMVAKSRGQA